MMDTAVFADFGGDRSVARRTRKQSESIRKSDRLHQDLDNRLFDNTGVVQDQPRCMDILGIQYADHLCFQGNRREKAGGEKLDIVFSVILALRVAIHQATASDRLRTFDHILQVDIYPVPLKSCLIQGLRPVDLVEGKESVTVQGGLSRIPFL